MPTFPDALTALVERERLEAEAPNWLQPGTLTEPFAPRALGVAHADLTLLSQGPADRRAG